MKAAVYAGTRNLYSDMMGAAKSLVLNSSVDKVYFLIEDDKFPYYLPDYVQCINVSEQKYFDKKCPNVYKLWTYMVLMRTVLTKLFPDLDKILSLDVDTFVMHNIDELWDLDLTGYYMAGVEEPLKSKPGLTYVNMGSVMFNLDKLRNDMVDDRVIKLLNTRQYPFAEQDCMNEQCRPYILKIPSTYNANAYTKSCEDPKIIHYANDKKYKTYPIYYQYQNMNWGEARKKNAIYDS